MNIGLPGWTRLGDANLDFRDSSGSSEVHSPEVSTGGGGVMGIRTCLASPTIV